MENRLTQNIAQKQTLQLNASQLQGLNLLATPAVELENLLALELQSILSLSLAESSSASGLFLKWLRHSASPVLRWEPPSA